MKKLNESILYNIKEAYLPEINHIYCLCGGDLFVFYNRKDASNFWKEGTLMSEGSEQKRYYSLYYGIAYGQNCVTDDIDAGFNYKEKVKTVFDMKDMENVKKDKFPEGKTIEEIIASYEVTPISKGD